MDLFSALPALGERNPPVTCGFLSQRPVAWSFDSFFYLPLNKRLCKQSRRRWFDTPSCSVWCHCNEDSWWISLRPKQCKPKSFGFERMPMSCYLTKILNELGWNRNIVSRNIVASRYREIWQWESYNGTLNRVPTFLYPSPRSTLESIFWSDIDCQSNTNNSLSPGGNITLWWHFYIKMTLQRLFDIILTLSSRCMSPGACLHWVRLIPM